VTNALKFTNKGFIELKLEKTDETDSSIGVCITVTDTGIGIKTEDLPALFNRFSQIDNSLQRQYHGAGLGLAVCQQLINLMGGTISVESEFGCGTRFIVKLTFPKLASSSRRKSTDSRTSTDIKVSSTSVFKKNRDGIRENADLSLNANGTVTKKLDEADFSKNHGKNIRRVSSLDDVMNQVIPRNVQPHSSAHSSGNNLASNRPYNNFFSFSSTNGSSSAMNLNSLFGFNNKLLRMGIVIDPAFAIRRSIYNSFADLGVHSFTFQDLNQLMNCFKGKCRTAFGQIIISIMLFNLEDALSVSNSTPSDGRANSPNGFGFIDAANKEWCRFEEMVARDHLRSVAMGATNQDLIPLFISMPVLEKLVTEESLISGDWEQQFTEDGLHQLVKQSLLKLSAKLASHLSNMRKGKHEFLLSSDRIKPVVMIRRVDQMELNGTNLLHTLGKYYLPSVNSTTDFNAGRRRSVSSNGTAFSGPRKSMESNSLIARIHKNFRDYGISPASPSGSNGPSLNNDLQKLMLRLLLAKPKNNGAGAASLSSNGNIAVFTGSFDIIYKPIYHPNLLKLLKELSSQSERAQISSSGNLDPHDGSERPVMDWGSVVDVAVNGESRTIINLNSTKSPPIANNVFNFAAGTALTTIPSVSRNNMIESKASLASDYNVVANASSSCNNLSTVQSHNSSGSGGEAEGTGK
jgi:hypothetical protein